MTHATVTWLTWEFTIKNTHHIAQPMSWGIPATTSKPPDSHTGKREHHYQQAEKQGRPSGRLTTTHLCAECISIGTGTEGRDTQPTSPPASFFLALSSLSPPNSTHQVLQPSLARKLVPLSYTWPSYSQFLGTEWKGVSMETFNPSPHTHTHTHHSRQAKVVQMTIPLSTQELLIRETVGGVLARVKHSENIQVTDKATHSPTNYLSYPLTKCCSPHCPRSCLQECTSFHCIHKSGLCSRRGREKGGRREGGRQREKEEKWERKREGEAESDRE